MSLRSPLSRVLGLGTAKEGVHHWWSQRVGSVALAVLSLWFLISLLVLGQLDFDSIAVWMASPVNSTLLILLLITMVHHSLLGVQVVVEDYVPNKGARILTMMVLKAVHIVIGLVGVLSILRVALGGVE
jgi:succinate dehydrogenase / fumarate reductase membrane anchor subunit